MFAEERVEVVTGAKAMAPEARAARGRRVRTSMFVIICSEDIDQKILL
jgi:hypothetical protein